VAPAPFRILIVCRYKPHISSGWILCQMSHIPALFGSPLANDERARDPLETDGSSQT
jgi:hypothetical protein